MSIISGPVLKVQDVQVIVSKVFPSKIIERRDKNTGQMRRYKIPEGSPMQLTVYSNLVEKENVPEKAIMILPFPMMAKTKRFKILNMSSYDDIYKDLGQFFNKKNLLDDIGGISWNTWDLNEDVSDLHSARYDTVVIASYTSLVRVSASFNLSNEMMQGIKQYYGHDYAFIICKMDSSAKFLPLAYVHELMPGDKLFVPTRHMYYVSTMAKFEQKVSRFEETSGEVEENMHKVMLQEDKYLHHKLKRATIASNAVMVKNGWNHTIFVINKPNLLSYSIIQNAEITVEPGKQTFILDHKKYLKLANIPNEITFNGIRDMHKVIISSRYGVNHDFIL